MLTIVKVSHENCSITSEALEGLSILSSVPSAMHIPDDGQADEICASLLRGIKRNMNTVHVQHRRCRPVTFSYQAFLLQRFTELRTGQVRESESCGDIPR